ncbi:MAG: NAD-dependent epimerase/dehydratase family protein [Candidatus Sumerlaeia bacterium]|nr:NAD-dependent epimerase/dehydratase family protein [Candidatus Sumerlaeia bacterium]
MSGGKLLVTGSTGLIGSECVLHFSGKGWAVHGIDNNMRREFFGPDGDTRWNLDRLRRLSSTYNHHELDIRDRPRILELVSNLKPDAVIHCAAQPSHDLAAQIPFADFETNATGTLNLLEACRQTSLSIPFIHMSTNKVYGDRPNTIPLVELETRWEYADGHRSLGINEGMAIDQCLHSIFGVSKLASDVMVQEYGRYFGMHTVCFRGGCLTGSAHSGAELHGFLSYITKCAVKGLPYKINGYKGKQVRDNIHAADVCLAMERFLSAPRNGEVYNLGGGPGNSVSLLEAIAALEHRTGRRFETSYSDQARKGDHICYYSDLSKLQADYPGWKITRTLDSIFDELVEAASRS